MREKFATDADRKNMILVCKLADNRRGKKTKYLKASQKLTLHKRQKCCQVPPLKSGPKQINFWTCFSSCPQLGTQIAWNKTEKGKCISYTIYNYNRVSWKKLCSVCDKERKLMCSIRSADENKRGNGNVLNRLAES